MNTINRVATLAIFVVSSFCFSTLPNIAPYDETYAATLSESERQSYDWEHVFLHSLDFRDGEIELPGGFAKLTVPEGFYYLSPEDSERLLNEAWKRNYGEYQGLGLLLPSHSDPLDWSNIWSVAIFFNEFGHASEARALDFDAEKLVRLKTKSHQEKYNQKVAANEVAYRLAGNYKLPSYEAKKYTLSWADKLQYSHRDELSIYHKAFIFGRQGNLEVMAVEFAKFEDEILIAMPKIIDALRFLPGYRYTDFDPNVDRVANFDIIEYYGYEDIPTFKEKFGEYFAEIVAAFVLLTFFILTFIFRSSANREAALAAR